eukprot:6459346-Amphidinium_carterae.1
MVIITATVSLPWLDYVGTSIEFAPYRTWQDSQTGTGRFRKDVAQSSQTHTSINALELLRSTEALKGR